MNRWHVGVILGLVLVAVPATPASAQLESDPRLVRVGQWLEVRGEWDPAGRFRAARIDLVQPRRYQVLIGEVTGQDEQGHITVLGQRVEVQAKTDIDKLPANDLTGRRVKVEGYYRGPRKFSAREIDPRGPGRERLLGRVDARHTGGGGVEFEIMTYRVVVPADVLVRHEDPPESYAQTAATATAIADRGRDEEDLFGEGYWLTESLQLSGQTELRALGERDFNLDERDREDRDDIEFSIRTRVLYQPSASFFALAELRHRELRRADRDDGRLSDSNTRLGEAYLYWIGAFADALDLQAGRVDFDDEREWIYDQNLDAVRAIWSGRRLRAELSYSETLSDGSPLDESARNWMAYLSGFDPDRHIAAYLVHREFDLGARLRRTHYGFRMLGEWLPGQESWLELAWLDGRAGPTATRAWAVDIGSTWQFHDRWALTLGYAAGQGDAGGGATDHTFRQTGLQDNNAKFAGVTSFRYYGELLDPELANLHVATAGLGFLPRAGLSLDLVWHAYRQDVASRRLIDAQIDQRPNGRDRSLGREIDLVLGWKATRNLDVETVAAWFTPGRAFRHRDSAFLAKLQLRYRF